MGTGFCNKDEKQVEVKESKQKERDQGRQNLVLNEHAVAGWIYPCSTNCRHRRLKLSSIHFLVNSKLERILRSLLRGEYDARGRTPIAD